MEGDPGQLQLADGPRGEEAFFCFCFPSLFFLFLSFAHRETQKHHNGPISLSLPPQVHHTFDSFYPKDGNPLVPDLTKNVGELILFFSSLVALLFSERDKRENSLPSILSRFPLFPAFVPFLNISNRKLKGALPLGINVAENMWTAGAGLAPKFVGTPVPLPPAPVKASSSAELPAPGSAPSAGSVDGGALYEPIPGIGGVSDTFVQPVTA